MIEIWMWFSIFYPKKKNVILSYALNDPRPRLTGFFLGRIPNFVADVKLQRFYFHVLGSLQSK